MSIETPAFFRTAPVRRALTWIKVAPAVPVSLQGQQEEQKKDFAMARHVDGKEKQRPVKRVKRPIDRACAVPTLSTEPAVCPTRVVFEILANLDLPAKDRTRPTNRN